MIPAGIAAGVVFVGLLALLLAMSGGDDDGPKDALAATTLNLTPVSVGGEPRGVAVGEGGVWVANYESGTVQEIDPGSRKPAGDPVRVGEQPEAVATGEGYVWVISSSDKSTRIARMHEVTADIARDAATSGRRGRSSPRLTQLCSADGTPPCVRAGRRERRPHRAGEPHRRPGRAGGR